LTSAIVSAFVRGLATFVSAPHTKLALPWAIFKPLATDLVVASYTKTRDPRSLGVDAKMSSPPPYDLGAALKAEWKPHRECPTHLIKELKHEVMTLPASFFMKPELFDSPIDALRRLNGYALIKGFAVVRTGGSEHSKKPYLNYHCVHWGEETRNYRKLEEHIRRNSEGEIVSDRKQETTSILKRNCQVRYGLSKKQVPRGSGIYRWVLKVPNPESNHSHSLAAFPLR
jgi:hypothetical protein